MAINIMNQIATLVKPSQTQTAPLSQSRVL